MFKGLAILCYLLAFVALQAHNVLPHHHHVESEMNEHHDGDHHEDHDNAPFDIENHDPAFGKLIVKPESFTSEIEKPVCITSQFMLLFDKLPVINNPRPQHPLYFHSALYSILLLHELGLRAPPSLFIPV